MSSSNSNPLLSTKPSDSGISVSLHPLILLTASDQITRHRVRNETGPIVGVLLGQQRGREITAEHAFAVTLKPPKDTGNWQFDQAWLEQRVQQFRDVHKQPALDVVGLFTLGPENGPLPDHVPLQKHITSLYNENSILLVIHPEAFISAQNTNGKLPLTVYESVNEIEPAKDDASMQVDSEEPLTLRFRSLPYSVETDEAEMIAIDYVAKGAGSAAAVVEVEKKQEAQSVEAEDKKGKKRADPPSTQIPSTTTADQADVLTTDEEDLIAGITTRLNSVRMLQSRLALLTKFIQTLPPSYLSDQDTALSQESPDPAHLPHLRSIQALITRLSLLTPSPSQPLEANSTTQTNGQLMNKPVSVLDSLQTATEAQKNDVVLAQMLALMGQDIQSLSELGRKFASVESSRAARGKGKSFGPGVGGGGVGGHGSLDDNDARVGGFNMRGGMLI